MKLSNEIKTALIALVVLLLTIWGYNYLKGKNIIRPTDEYFAVYDKIDGLIESGNVLIKGYKVGSISQIKFDHKNTGKFIVKFTLEERVKIPLNSKAIISSSSIIVPAKDIVIEFSDTNGFYNSGDTLLSDFDEGMMGALEPVKDKAEDLVNKIDQTISSLNNTLNDTTQQALKSSVLSFEATLDEFETSMRPGGSLNKTISNLQAITANLRSKNEQISELIDNLHAISDSIHEANLKMTLATLDSTLRSTEAIMAKINEGNGTAGLLINDSSLYINLSNSASSLDSLLKDLNEHPKRYVHFSLFGKKDKPEKD